MKGITILLHDFMKTEKNIYTNYARSFSKLSFSIFMFDLFDLVITFKPHKSRDSCRRQSFNLFKIKVRHLIEFRDPSHSFNIDFSSKITSSSF